MIHNVYELCAPLFMFGSARIDSATANMPNAYKIDTAFFEAHPHRRIYLRKVQFGEFDPPFEIGDWMQIPQLWVEVIQVHTGSHRVTPVYRGKAFFSEIVATDAQVGGILVEMQRRGGIDAEEFIAFEKQMQQKLTDAMDTATIEAAVGIAESQKRIH